MFEPALHWVDGLGPHRLALAPRPRGGDGLADEMAGWRHAGVDAVVSLLERHEVRELELREQPALCAAEGMAFHDFPIPDRGTPVSARELAELLRRLHGELLRGQAMVIHCRAGIGRTGLVAGCLLHLLGVPTADIFHRLSRSRGVAMPDTAAQVEWVERFAQGGGGR